MCSDLSWILSCLVRQSRNIDMEVCATVGVSIGGCLCLCTADCDGVLVRAHPAPIYHDARYHWFHPSKSTSVHTIIITYPITAGEGHVQGRKQGHMVYGTYLVTPTVVLTWPTPLPPTLGPRILPDNITHTRQLRGRRRKYPIVFCSTHICVYKTHSRFYWDLGMADHAGRVRDVEEGAASG